MGTTTRAATLDPAVLLFGSTRRRVLGWLLGHADEAYYLRELVRHIGGAVGAVQRELEQLTAAGLVRRDVRGKQVYFQANRQAAIFPELQALFAKTVGLVDILREALMPLTNHMNAAFVFGSAGVDFEKRITDIYQRCRTTGDIQAAFDQLQEELSAEISEAMTRTRQLLLEHFDEEVHEKLRISLRDSQTYLNRYERWLMDITRHELAGFAAFDDGQPAFRLRSNPYPEAPAEIPVGSYVLPRHGSDAHLYRLGHPLAERVVQAAKERQTPAAAIGFDLSGSEVQISALQEYLGAEGELQVSQMTVESLDQAEDYVLVVAVTANGQVLDESTAMRLFSLPARVVNALPSGWRPQQQVLDLMLRRQTQIQQMIAKRNAGFVETEAERLDGWADDRKSALERDLKDLDRQIKETRREVSAGLSLDDKLAGQKRIRALESQRSIKRRALFEAQDEVDAQRNALIAAIEQKLEQKVRGVSGRTARLCKRHSEHDREPRGRTVRAHSSWRRS